MTMPYTYDTDRAPLWADSVRGELVADPKAYAETKPGKLTEAELDRAIAQKRRDTICATSQAPRIPRHRPITGTSKQGRVMHREGDCAPTEPLVSRLESIEDAGHTLVWLLCLAVLLVMVPALIFGVSWKDALGWLAMIGCAL